MTLTIRVLEDGDQGLLERVEAGVLDRGVDPRASQIRAQAE